MIERVHDHLTGELKQNARTDTIFVVTAVILNLVILAVNTSFALSEGDNYDPVPILTPKAHVLNVEVLSANGWEWQSAGRLRFEFENANATGGNLALPEKPRDIRFQIDSTDEHGWAVATEARRQNERDTVVMYLFFVLQVFINFAVVFGLLKGKKMRMTILDGLMRMYRDQSVDAYYSVTLLKNYSTRYLTFISIVGFLAMISIIVPFILRYM